jgi:uncharacterized membrane protein YgcG
MMIRYCAMWLMAMCAMLAARADVAIPQLTSRITDLTGTLSGETVNRLELKLGAFDVATGVKISVLIVPTTQPADIEQYPIPVLDRSVVLVVAKNDRRVHIDVGSALAGPLPDAVTRRIVNDSLTPHFEVGDYDGGVETATNAMMAVIEGDPLPETDKRWSDHEAGVAAAGPKLLAVGLLAVLLTSGLLVGRSRGWLAGGGGWQHLGPTRSVAPEFAGGGAGASLLSRWWRLLRHLAAPEWRTRRAFPAATRAAIESAIERAQQTHRGAISFVIETALAPLQVMSETSRRDRAALLFAWLKVWDTPRNNGVLIYVLLADRAVEIVADRGLADAVRQPEWEGVCRLMESHFRSGRYEAGALAGVDAVGSLLARQAPPPLPDRPTLL